MIILITGTRTGIGRSLAEHFLKSGHQVIGCSRNPQAIEHPNYRHHEIDLTDSAMIKSMFRAVRREFGALDALVNNAGTSNMNHFMMTPENVARDIFELNFFAVLNCCREAVKLLRRRPGKSASIVNVSTVAVAWALDGQLVYSASKSAVEQLTKVMSKELSAFDIRVNGIGLPPVRTRLTRTLPAPLLESVLGRQTIKRPCTADDVVGPVEFLLSEQSAFLTGETIYLGGVN